ncbi:MAG: hypothetical protein U0263_42105 [Polyangiaceae bacterium]
MTFLDASGKPSGLQKALAPRFPRERSVPASARRLACKVHCS